MVYDHQNWRAKAACRNLNPEQVDEIFFLGKGGSTRKAKQFCDRCPVQRECLDYSLYYGESGVWGGMSLNERTTLTNLLGLLSKAQLESRGVNTTETRDQTQWGLGTRQILESRRPYSQKLQAPVEQVPQPQDRLPLMLVVEL